MNVWSQNKRANKSSCGLKPWRTINPSEIVTAWPFWLQKCGFDRQFTANC